MIRILCLIIGVSINSIAQNRDPLKTEIVTSDLDNFFANPKEKELCLEFNARMLEKNYDGWLYSSSPSRPYDLGYWMGYKITKAYYDRMEDKQKVMQKNSWPQAVTQNSLSEK
jgi:hypothetical protein